MLQAIVDTIGRAQKLIDAGKAAKAESLLRKALKSTPNQPDILHLLGIIALRGGDNRRAVDLYTAALRCRPGHAVYEYNLGLAYLRAGEFEPAAVHLGRAVELQPDLSVAYSDLCLALARCGKNEVAVEAGRVAVSHNPEDPCAHYNLALACDLLKDYEAALSHYEKAAALLPEHPGVQYDLGIAYADRGDADLARACYQKVVQLKPDYPAIYRSLTHVTQYSSPDHEDVRQLRALLAKQGLSDDDRTDIFFALAKIYQDCGLYDEAFDHYRQGNRLQDQKHAFDPGEFSRFITATISFCASSLINAKRLYGNPSRTPVFVVGTPRSGTSLVEQIISSHPDAFGAGELDWFKQAAATLPEMLKTSVGYPGCLHELDKTTIDGLASKYLQYIHLLAAGQSRIVDKMPGNFLYLGLIHILFPAAKIIHCVRESRDACLSMFCNYFPMGVPYSYDLFKLGVYYSQYQRMMAYWRSVLPVGTMAEVHYEVLVNNQESESRRLLAFIGLDWDEACLAFYKTKRRVNTASDLQVSKPIYTSSIGRWKQYRKHLGPLEEGLNFQKNH